MSDKVVCAASWNLPLQGKELMLLPDHSGHHEPHGGHSSGIEAAHHNRVHYSSGRPNFNSILSGIQASHPGEVVGVFYCGPPALGHTLEAECRGLSGSTRRSGTAAAATASSKLHTGPGCCSLAGVEAAADLEASTGRGARFHFYKEVF